MTVYVTMIDTFMSGWGRATDRKNKLIFVCADQAEAETVADNAMARTDMRKVFIHKESRPPACYRPKRGNEYEFGPFYVQIKTREDYPSWYQPGWFQAQRKTG